MTWERQYEKILPPDSFSVHRKSFRNIISASSTPTQAKLFVDGFENDLKILHSGFRIKIFSQFAGPTINILVFLPYCS